MGLGVGRVVRPDVAVAYSVHAPCALLWDWHSVYHLYHHRIKHLVALFLAADFKTPDTVDYRVLSRGPERLTNEPTQQHEGQTNHY